MSYCLSSELLSAAKALDKGPNRDGVSRDRQALRMGPCARLRICKSERNKHAGSCHYSLEPLMPDTSHALSLPLIQPSQAQKHVTHNEALRILDAVVQLVVIAADQSGPPTAPQSGDRYIVAPPGVGAWLGHDGDIAVYADAAWSFITPLPGWTAQVLAPQSAVLFDAPISMPIDKVVCFTPPFVLP